jgi:hypothetical protein
MFKRLCSVLVGLASVPCMFVGFGWLTALGMVGVLVVLALIATTFGYLIGSVAYHTPGLVRHGWPHIGPVAAYLALAGLHFFDHHQLVTDLYLVLALAHGTACRKHLWGHFIHPLCDTWAKHCPCGRVLRFGRRVLSWMIGVLSKQ